MVGLSVGKVLGGRNRSTKMTVRCELLGPKYDNVVSEGVHRGNSSVG